MNKESDSDVEKESRRSTDLYVKAVKKIEVRKRLNLGEVPDGLPPMQTLLPHILYDLATFFGEKKLFQHMRNILVNLCSGKGRVRLNTYDVTSRLAVDCVAAGSFLKK